MNEKASKLYRVLSGSDTAVRIDGGPVLWTWTDLSDENGASYGFRFSWIDDEGLVFEEVLDFRDVVEAGEVETDGNKVRVFRKNKEPLDIELFKLVPLNIDSDE